ncbi:MAG TPA: rRNA maturation RNase YbeY [Steroidobacteraceae bacterium]|jgi:probable rRNA maturation factor|nr:rRNA maturation RNase YbeY [Steroidobacteraceae bacterium]
MRPREAHLEVTRRARIWSPPAAQLAVWAQAALGRRARGTQLGLRVVGTSASRRLNAHFRGTDRPTNVLSFPAPPLPAGAARGRRPLGDLVVCAPLLRREAQRQGKSLRAHWAHLVVHGALHLIGYDHERARDARRMQRREIAVLKRLGFANPYRSA